MKKGVLIIVAILLMILAVFPLVDYFYMKYFVYGKGDMQDATEWAEVKNEIIQELDMNAYTLKTFNRYFQEIYAPNSGTSFTYGALYRIFQIQDNGNTLFEFDTVMTIEYISYISDLFIIWFILFAILQVPIFTMRLMGLKEDKGGKRI